MELNSLIFLLLLVYCSTVSSIEIITESSRLWPNPFDRLFNATKFRKSESREKPDLEFYHPDDLKLLHTVKSQKIIPQQQLANDKQFYPIAKLVEELFLGFKFTTSRPPLRKSTNSPAPAKEKVNPPVRKSGKSITSFIFHSNQFYVGFKKMAAHLRKKENTQNLSGVLLSPLRLFDQGFTRDQLRERILWKTAKRTTPKTLKRTDHRVIRTYINFDQRFTLQIESATIFYATFQTTTSWPISPQRKIQVSSLSTFISSVWNCFFLVCSVQILMLNIEKLLNRSSRDKNKAFSSFLGPSICDVNYLAAIQHENSVICESPRNGRRRFSLPSLQSRHQQWYFWAQHPIQ